MYKTATQINALFIFDDIKCFFFFFAFSIIITINKVLLIQNLNFKSNVQKVYFLAKLPMGKYFDHLFE